MEEAKIIQPLHPPAFLPEYLPSRVLISLTILISSTFPAYLKYIIYGYNELSLKFSFGFDGYSTPLTKYI